MSNSKILSGKILKGIGGFYYVMDGKGDVYECKARGLFRKKGVVPLPGDNVFFSKGGFIEEIEQRKNELARPKVANIDIAAIVVSAEKPKIDYKLCDKLLIAIKKVSVKPLLVINKCDTADRPVIKKIEKEYRNVCKTVCISAKTGEGIEALKALFKNSCVCFAGQSAVGKSSIINALMPEVTLETGGLSKKADRGTHTTRQAEFLVSKSFPGIIVDTPGFTFIESADIPPEELCVYYDDMEPYAGKCRFTSCLHSKEPGCCVKDAVEKGLINEGRYLRYLEILKEIEDKRLKKYD